MPGKTQLTLQQGPTRTPATSHIITNRCTGAVRRSGFAGNRIPVHPPLAPHPATTPHHQRTSHHYIF